MTLDSRLKEIKSRCDAATEGPWEWVQDTDDSFGKEKLEGDKKYSEAELCNSDKGIIQSWDYEG